MGSGPALSPRLLLALAAATFVPGALAGAGTVVPIEQSNQQLVRAVYSRDVEKVRALVQPGDIVDDSDGAHAFRGAIERGYDDVALAFLDAGAPVNVRDGARSTPLMWAAAAGNARLTRELVRRGADPSAADNVGWTALHHAAIGQHLEVVRVLLEAGADAEVRDLTGETPVDLASYRRFSLQLPLRYFVTGRYWTLFDTPVRSLLKRHLRRRASGGKE